MAKRVTIVSDAEAAVPTAATDRTVQVWIGGSAGDGIASAGEAFAKVCSRSGLHVMAYNSYQSVIRGGHVCMALRAGEEKVYTHGDDYCQFLIALNADTVVRHGTRLLPTGGVLFNADRIQVKQEQLTSGAQALGLPVSTLASNPLMQNTVAIGALIRLLGLQLETLIGVIQDTFGRKSQTVVEENIAAAKAGYEYAAEHFPPPRAVLKQTAKRRMLVSGNQAICLGALAAGCKFYAAYPMTPASSIMHWFAAHAAQYGLLLKQAEDEIAAINMAIGAGHVGVRAMTGTSGGGFALMTEAIGMAGMTETPVVVVLSQRGGPSTGLPTKTEQGDLFQMLGASQGDFPKIILAPRTPEECFAMTAEAFNLAERYQCPVILASDLLLSEHQETVDGFDLNVPIDRGELVDGHAANGEYKRFAITPTGISPRALPGHDGTMYVTASDEHAEDGVLISDVFTDPPTRARMMEKRMRKQETLLAELHDPTLIGPAQAQVTLVGWGSTYGLIREVMQRLAAERITANALALTYLWPLKAEVTARLLRCAQRLIVIENNYSAQLARLLASETGVVIEHRILKYDGEPFTPGPVVARIKEILQHG